MREGLGQNLAKGSALRREVLRKSVHAASFVILPMAGILGKQTIVALLASISILYAFNECLRAGKRSRIQSPLTRLYLPLLREEELSKGPAMAPLYLSLGVITCLTIFPEPIGYASIAIVSLGDGLAGLERAFRGYGERASGIGRLRGSSLSFAVALMGASIFISPLASAFAVLLASILEAFVRRFDDNLAIPIASALSLLAMESIGFEAQALEVLRNLDRAVYWCIATHRIEVLNQVFQALDWFTVLLLAPAIALHAWKSDAKKTASFLVLLGATISSVLVLKVVFQIPRPCVYYSGEGSILLKDDYGFPSSHNAVAGFLLGYASPFRSKGFRRSWRSLTGILCLLMFSQSLYNGVHWLTDALAGLALGAFIAWSAGFWLVKREKSEGA